MNAQLKAALTSTKLDPSYWSWLVGSVHHAFTPLPAGTFVLDRNEAYNDAIESAIDAQDHAEAVLDGALQSGRSPNHHILAQLNAKLTKSVAQAQGAGWRVSDERTAQAVKSQRLLELIDTIEQLTGKPRFEALARLMTALGYPTKPSALRKLRSVHGRTFSAPLERCSK